MRIIENIKRARLLSLKSILGLEIKGMKRAGKSAYSIIKKELGFKGNKLKVYNQLEEYLKDDRQQ